MEREIRDDLAIANRMTRAGVYFLAAMAFMAGVGLWILASGHVEPANQEQSAAFVVGLLAVFAATANVFVAFGKLMSSYRCPQCGARLPVVPGTDQVGSKIRYACETCDVEWSTGVTVAPSD
jgi:DNA-directed RNA polymerase subunit RPC12/RpoP